MLFAMNAFRVPISILNVMCVKLLIRLEFSAAADNYRIINPVFLDASKIIAIFN
jgi:hypothetical protein